MTAKEDPVYVGIENPVEIRRALLESSKALIHILQANERQKARRERKKEIVAKYKNAMEELRDSVAQLRKLMPRVKVSSLPKKAKPRPEPVHVEAHSAIKAPKQKPLHITETQKLELELKDIEAKLSKL